MPVKVTQSSKNLRDTICNKTNIDKKIPANNEKACDALKSALKKE